MTDHEHGSKNHLETSQGNTNARKSKKRLNQQQSPQYEQLFQHKKQLMMAMEQNVELFESFGGQESSRIPHDAFGPLARGGETPPSSSNHQGVEKQKMRESYERKVVPLQSNPLNQLASGLTSREGSDYVPGSSSIGGSPQKLILHDTATVKTRTNNGSFMNVQEQNT